MTVRKFSIITKSKVQFKDKPYPNSDIMRTRKSAKFKWDALITLHPLLKIILYALY